MSNLPKVKIIFLCNKRRKTNFWTVSRHEIHESVSQSVPSLRLIKPRPNTVMNQLESSAGIMAIKESAGKFRKSVR